MMFHWAEISELSDDPRFQTLSRELTSIGIENSFSFSQLSLDQDLGQRIRELSGTHTQLRVGGRLRDRVKEHIDTWPATLLTLRSADALVCENHIWWARNFLSEGVQTLIAESGVELNLTGSALILGATPEARSVIHALVRIGYSKFILCDLDEGRLTSLQDQLRQVYFNVNFRLVKFGMLTQLPAGCSVAVNTLEHSKHQVELTELAYLNFLSTGGCWLDLSLGAKSSDLDEEATTVGAQVADGWRVWARADLLWLNYVLHDHKDMLSQLSLDHLTEAYRSTFGTFAAPTIQE